MNIKLTYLYRDGSNYKQFNEVVFSNLTNLLIEEIEKKIQEKLTDSLWFVAKDWELPDMHFKQYAWDPETDHDWHEFRSIEETLESVTEKNSIGDFLLLLKKSKQITF